MEKLPVKAIQTSRTSIVLPDGFSFFTIAVKNRNKKGLVPSMRYPALTNNEEYYQSRTSPYNVLLELFVIHPYTGPPMKQTTAQSNTNRNSVSKNSVSRDKSRYCVMAASTKEKESLKQ